MKHAHLVSVTHTSEKDEMIAKLRGDGAKRLFGIAWPGDEHSQIREPGYESRDGPRQDVESLSWFIKTSEESECSSGAWISGQGRRVREIGHRHAISYQHRVTADVRD
jgi:hypothetical protein